MNSKGQISNVIWMILILFVLLFVGMGLAFGGMIIQWVFDIGVPEISNLGMVGNSNLTEISSYTLTPVNTVVQSFTWMAGLIYIIGLISCFGFAISFRITGDKWLMAFFIACMFLLIVTSIFMSNIYEEFFNDGSEVGVMLHDYVLLSFLILYSPMIMSVVGFICGIIMFTYEDGGGTA